MSETKPKFYDFINVYEFETELPGSGETIKFKPVSTGQIKKLLTYENEKNYVLQEKALDELISSSVLVDGFDVSNMLLDDRFFLLVELRKKTKGEVLEYQIECPECGSQSINRVNLDSLPVKKLDTNLSPTVDLTKGIKVHLRYLTRRDQMQEIKPNDFPRNMTELQMAYAFNVLFNANAIDKIETPKGIDSDIPFKDRVYFVENIPTGELDKIKEKLDEMSFGLDLKYSTVCVHCKHKNEYQIPIQNNFFG